MLKYSDVLLNLWEEKHMSSYKHMSKSRTFESQITPCKMHVSVRVTLSVTETKESCVIPD